MEKHATAASNSQTGCCLTAGHFEMQYTQPIQPKQIYNKAGAFSVQLSSCSCAAAAEPCGQVQGSCEKGTPAGSRAAPTRAGAGGRRRKLPPACPAAPGCCCPPGPCTCSAPWHCSGSSTAPVSSPLQHCAHAPTVADAISQLSVCCFWLCFILGLGDQQADWC